MVVLHLHHAWVWNLYPFTKFVCHSLTHLKDLFDESHKCWFLPFKGSLWTYVSYPNFVRGLSFVDLLILASRLMVLNASYSVKTNDHSVFWSRMRKIPKKGGGKRVFSLVFLDPSSPRLASSSPGPPNSFMVKKSACLGKLIASGLSFGSPRQAATAPKWPFAYK